MDNPSQESGALNAATSIDAFSALLDTPEVVEKTGADLEKEVIAEITAPKIEAIEAQETDPQETVTIEVDGKPVEVLKSELADHYKNGLRQSDYTKKTMEVAEARKTAEAETAKARSERQTYAANLNEMATRLNVVLQEQNKTDWDALLTSDPVEFLRQKHLYDQRHATLQQTLQQREQLAAQEKQETEKAFSSFLSEQHNQLIAKLPDWKDSAKAGAEKTAIANYLLEQGFDKNAVAGITDHKAVILGRKAMLYDAMMAKANAAVKKVTAAPQRVIKSGIGEAHVNDPAQAAKNRLAKTGRMERADAVSIFSNFV